MSAQRLPKPDELIYAVKLWKDTLDPSAKWWQRLFHRFVYLPFNEFSLKVVKIPPATSVTIEGNKSTFSWLEDGGFFGSEHEADQACLNERTSYQAMTFGRVFPWEGAQCVGPTIFPRAKRPLKRAQPIFGMMIKSRKQDEREQQQWKQALVRLNQALEK